MAIVILTILMNISGILVLKAETGLNLPPEIQRPITIAPGNGSTSPWQGYLLYILAECQNQVERQLWTKGGKYTKSTLAGGKSYTVCNGRAPPTLSLRG